MKLLKKKISYLPEAESLIGLKTIGVDAANNSVQVSLEFVQQAADEANSQADIAATAASNANEAASEASTAGENAQRAASAASTAATAAGEKADYAQEQGDYAKQQVEGIDETIYTAVESHDINPKAHQDIISGKEDKINKGAVNGYTPLDGEGKVPVQYMHQAAITDTFVVNNEQSMLYLDAHKGDICIRNDESKTYILQQEPATALENWVLIVSPTSGVSSINGQRGDLTVDKAFIGLGAVDNTSDAEKPVSTAQQTALNAKINTSDPRLSDARPANGGQADSAKRTNITNIDDKNIYTIYAEQPDLSVQYFCGVRNTNAPDAGYFFYEVNKRFGTAQGYIIASAMGIAGNIAIGRRFINNVLNNTWTGWVEELTSQYNHW